MLPPSSPSHAGDPVRGSSRSGDRFFLAHPSDHASVDPSLKETDADPIEENEDSPFEMVRAAVSNKDNPNLPSLTIRVWILGLSFLVVMSIVNQFFWFRETPIGLGGVIVMLLSYPLGKFLAWTMPQRTVDWGRFGRFELNPGPFSIKEHVLVSVVANSGAGTAYAIDVVVIKKLFYKMELSFFASLLLILTSQLVGYGLAGIARKYLVRPAAMIWPSSLVTVALFRTFHEREEKEAAQRFAWYFVPGYLFTGLGSISLLCLLAPSSLWANQLGDGRYGLGMFSLTFDWSMVSSAYLSSPIATPFWAACNMFGGFVTVMWFIVPLAYYFNVWGSSHFPIYTPATYDVYGHAYNTTRVMPGGQYSEGAYQEYSPLRLSFQFAITYALSFASFASILTYIALNYSQEIKDRFTESRTMRDDIHAKLMRRYPEVPAWWYTTIFVVNGGLAIVLCEWAGIELPWWALILALGISSLFIIPVGIISAVSNQAPGLNVITEFIIGYLLPGKPIANVTFKTYGTITMTQGLTLIGDMKLGHYMKIPPRHMFICQAIGTTLAGVIQLATAFYLMENIPRMCELDNLPWTCRGAHTFYSASVIWGLIGPSKMFGPDSPYHLTLWFFLLGFLLPIPVYLLQRKYPNRRWLQHIHVPIVLGALDAFPPGPALVYPMWFLACYILNYWVHDRYHEWWERLGFIFSVALDSGLAVAGLVIFFAFQSPGLILSWWGNDHVQCPRGREPMFAPVPFPA
ncbi:oligopeptide transporter [Dimargaris cristalligena]|uniref:Oligopeptide transporter n=1 Tax=Dimargaris cristalligena TaxID=215637 RepID=A0A4P9ZU10_9FUNG|nr:oligopeptide transporter [Dimargaris cristalligena]|eukprot:RKP37025.1 oligopeptide transporter [Dimargaris cristalligena]